MKQIISKLRLLILSGLVFLIILPPLPAFALSVQDVPNPRQTYGGWVTDMADVLSDDTEQQLNRLITQFEFKTTIEMAVVTVPETQAYASPKAFTTELFNTWGIGKARHNNGLLFMISVQDRRVEIETGLGLEAILPTPTLKDLLATEIIPELSKDDYDGATLSGTQAIIETLSDEISALPSAEDSSAIAKAPSLLWHILLTASIAIVFTATCTGLYGQYLNYRDRQPDAQKLKRSVLPAGAMERGWSLLLDLILLSIAYIFVAFLLAGPYKSPLVVVDEQIPVPMTMSLVLGNLEGAFDLGVLMGWSGFGAALLIYRTIAEAALKCTFGQLMGGVRVVKADNSKLGISPKRLKKLKAHEESPISYYAAFVRSLMLSIDGLFLYLVGAWLISHSDKSQRLGDRLAETVVICRKVNLPYRRNADSSYMDSSLFWGSLSSSGGGFSGGSSGDFGGGSSGDFGAGGHF